MVASTKKRVLLVEDDSDIQETYRALLEMEGYSVESAYNGQEALELLHATELPAVILLDLMMPTMDGFQFREMQIKDPLIANIPVIIMSADGHVESKKTRIGCANYLKKPANVDIVLETVGKYFR